MINITRTLFKPLLFILGGNLHELLSLVEQLDGDLLLIPQTQHCLLALLAILALEHSSLAPLLCQAQSEAWQTSCAC